MTVKDKIKEFFIPDISKKFLARAFFIALIAYFLFGYILIPLRIMGRSMEPTYGDGSFNFCFRLSYLFSEPRRHDVVAVRFSGERVMLLKRVIAMEGEKVEFVEGKLLVDGKKIDEPYLRYPSTWNLSARQVKKNFVYVVGDNRNVLMEKHHFGQTSIDRIAGKVLW
jgi:signal peptidase I